MLKKLVEDLIRDVINDLIKSGKLEKDFLNFNIEIEKSSKPEFGDYAARVYKIVNKADLPEKIWRNFSTDDYKTIIDEIRNNRKFKTIFKDVKFSPPVFINFFLAENYLQKQVKEILMEKEKFGDLKIGKKEKVNLEFISANPTGPLTLGNGRGGFCGDVLANVLKHAGYNVEREYYVNDVGEQIIKLGAWEYKGKYIDELKKKIKDKDPCKAGEKAAKVILEKMIKQTVKRMNIRFDTWFSEKSLHEKKEVDKVINLLKRKKLAYEKDSALWFKSSKFGDDKDRVLIKENKEKTYLASDIAYLKNKFERGFKKLIFFWGADHYGYMARIIGAGRALGYKESQVQIIIMQLVRLMEKGKEIRMSKRAGTYITLDELIDEVGLDAARFFFLMRSPDSHLNFDFDLAKKKSQKNPVFYVQYAYARINSILKKTKIKAKSDNLNLLTSEPEFDLIRQIIRFPEIIEQISRDYQVQKLPQYALDLADSFHRFYEKCQVITDDKKQTQARLALVSAARIVLKNVLDIMGISAPLKM